MYYYPGAVDGAYSLRVSFPFGHIYKALDWVREHRTQGVEHYHDASYKAVKAVVINPKRFKQYACRVERQENYD